MPLKVVHNRPFREWVCNSSEKRTVVGNFLFPANWRARLLWGLDRCNEVLMNRRTLADSVCDNKPTRRPPILIKTLLNKVHRIKSFVYHSVKLRGNDESLRIIAEIIPNVLVKGEDWAHYVSGREIVEANGGKVVLAPLVEGKSTTDIIKNIQQADA
jgi:hypothetical protein